MWGLNSWPWYQESHALPGPARYTLHFACCNETYKQMERWRKSLGYTEDRPSLQLWHGSVLHYRCGPQQGLQGDKNVSNPSQRHHLSHSIEHTKFIQDMIQEVCVLHPIGLACQRAPQGVQGQMCPQVHQENGEDTHLCQEEERGAEQCLGAMRKVATKDWTPSPLWNKACLELESRRK